MIRIGGQDVLDVRFGSRMVREVRLGDLSVWGRDDFLTFTAAENNASVKINYNNQISNPARLLYSTDGGATWSNYELRSTITLANIGDTVKFKAQTGGNDTLGYNETVYHYFTCIGVSISGNVNSLLDEEYKNVVSLPDYCFYGLFKGGHAVSAKHLSLSADSIGKYCYANMFRGASHIVDAPDILATRFDTGCLSEMFSGCESLVTPPRRISGMADSCCLGMFYGCRSLVRSPELVSEVVSSNCYKTMFATCNSLSDIRLAYRGNFSSECFGGWVSAVSDSGTFHYSGSDRTEGYSAIPSGWSVVPYA